METIIVTILMAILLLVILRIFYAIMIKNIDNRNAIFKNDILDMNERIENIAVEVYEIKQSLL